MRLDDYRNSDNVEFRGSSGGGGFGFGGGGGGGMGGLLFALVASRFGIGGIVVLGIIMFFFGGLGSFGGGGQQAVGPQQQVSGQRYSDCQTNETVRFSCAVLASTEDTWAQLFQASGQRYQPPTLVVYDRSNRSGCGAAQAAMGPFYCPADQSIYIDPTFFDQLATRFQAEGDFAQAYVIAHEVGHHIQTVTGISDTIRRGQSGVGEAAANALQVRMELQADCLAGVWAANARTRSGEAAMEPGDLQEGLRAAAAIGDDTLQQAAQGYTVPESFTHGTSAQRQQALNLGYSSGRPETCLTYTQDI